jgi:colanic acid biosynthesis glycosyl transferase WcaI
VKILYVSQYFPPEMGAPAARVSELARHWTEDGHEVTVLTGFPNHPTGVLHPRYRDKFRHMVCHEEIGRIRVVRTWLLPLPNRRRHERILNYSSFSISAAATGTFLSRPDVVIATSPQLLVGLSGYYLAAAKRVPFIFEVRDLWPESLMAVGMGTHNSLMNRALGGIADFLYARADRIVLVSPAFREHLTERRLISPKKLSIVENGVETGLFSPAAEDRNLKQRLGLQGKFVVGYIGTIGMAHGLETLIAAAVDLQLMAPEVVFLIVGEGAEKQKVRELAHTKNLTNLVFVEQQPRDKIPQYINACDACLVLLRKTDLFQTVIPTKMLEFMSCARPILLAVDGQARSIVEHAEAGLFVEPENASALVEAICRLRDNPVLRDQFGRNGRLHILAHYSRRQTATTYISLLESVLGRSESKAAA